MKITAAEFITSAPKLSDCPDWDLPEIAFVGRSNVGKSSLINMLLGRKGLAKTSNTPGKTRLMNFYKINEAFALVDLPGYGYAKVSKTMQAAWQKHFEEYLRKRPNRLLVVHLMDLRHKPQANDEQMLSWLESHDIPTIIVLTKADKLSKSEIIKGIHQVSKTLGIESDKLFAVSAENGYGKDALWQFLNACLESVSISV